MLCTPETIGKQLLRAERLWMFLDYDGTLAEFAPTPDHIHPDPKIITLLTNLAHHPRIRIAVISGRRLGHVRSLVPVPGVWLAGTYGVELQTPDGQQINRLEYDSIRPTLETVKPRWELLIAHRQGFFLEDKGWSLALHARFAGDEEADTVLAQARRTAADGAQTDAFRMLGGHKFLEIGPALAHKGHTVEYLLDRFRWPGAVALYLGDDDKDEEAFAVIKAQGGIAVLVAKEARETAADCRLDSPQAARQWLTTLLRHHGPPEMTEETGQRHRE